MYIYVHMYLYMCVCCYCLFSFNHQGTLSKIYFPHYSGIKKNEIMPFAAIWMNLEIIIPSEVNQKKKANIIWYHLYVESKIWHKWTYLQNRNRFTDRENRLVIANESEGMIWEFGIRRCKLLYVGCRSNKVLLSSTGNDIQYPVINHNGKEYEKNVYTCITELLCCTAEINTTL